MTTQAHKKFLESVRKLLENDFGTAGSKYIGSLTDGETRCFFYANGNSVRCLYKLKGEQEPYDIYQLDTAEDILQFLFDKFENGYKMSDRSLPTEHM